MSPLAYTNRLYKKFREHQYGLSLSIYLGAAVLTGAGCVLFMRAFEFVDEHRLLLDHLGGWRLVAIPLLFLSAVAMIRLLAPSAEGAGIPQTIFAAKHMADGTFKQLRPLLSFRTMVIKILALLVGLWAGASTGREGPTVHVAACLFFGTALILHRFFKLPLNMRSAVVAGGAAGLAAAFNTPLAGVTFAIEELSSDYFSSIKDAVLMAIIVAGLAAKSLTGEYSYFGRLSEPAAVSVHIILLVGIFSGIGGALFSTLLVKGRRRLVLIRGWKQYAIVVVLSFAVLAVAVASGMQGIMGPGNLAAQNYVHGNAHANPALFSVLKMLATLFTYWSGIAGGIFAPCLSMGSAMGAWAALWQNAPVAICAVMGMAGFLAGAIQAPITSFVIIYEMTGHHKALLPIMLAALIGYMIARLLKTQHLYQTLAEHYAGALAEKKATG